MPTAAAQDNWSDLPGLPQPPKPSLTPPAPVPTARPTPRPAPAQPPQQALAPPVPQRRPVAATVPPRGVPAKPRQPAVDNWSDLPGLPKTKPAKPAPATTPDTGIFYVAGTGPEHRQAKWPAGTTAVSPHMVRIHGHDLSYQMIGGKPHILDPTTGQPLETRGQRHAREAKESYTGALAGTGLAKPGMPAPQQAAISGALETGANIAQKAEPYIQAGESLAYAQNRMAAAVSNPISAAGNVAAKRGAQQAVKAGAQYQMSPSQVPGFFQGLFSREALHEAKRAMFSPEQESFQPFSIQRMAGLHIPGLKPGSALERGIDAAGDMGASAGVDWISSRGQGGLARLLKVRAFNPLSTLAEDAAKAGKLGSTGTKAADWLENTRHSAELRQIQQRSEAVQHLLRNDAVATLSEHGKMVGGLHGVGLDPNAVTRDVFGKGKRKLADVLDTAVYHWLEGGGEGARYGSRKQVEHIASLAVNTPEQKQYVADMVRQLGERYEKSWRRTGVALERAGILEPGTTKRMGGRYVWRMYESGHGNPAQMSDWMEHAREEGTLTPEMEKLFGKKAGRLGATGAMGGPGHERKLTTWAEREKYGPITSASQTLQEGVTQRSRMVAKGQTLKEIARTPSLAEKTAATYVPGKVSLNDPRYKAAEGLAVRPDTKKLIDEYLVPKNTGEANAFDKTVRWIAGTVKQSRLTGSLPAWKHKNLYDMTMGRIAAAEAGVNYGAPHAVRGRREWVEFDKTGKLSDEWLKADKDGVKSTGLEALRRYAGLDVRHTRRLDEQAQAMGMIAGKTDRNVPTKVAYAVGGWTQRGLSNIEMAHKIALTEQLAPKLGWKLAAETANKAIGDARNDAAWIKKVDRYGGLPFLAPRIRTMLTLMRGTALHPEAVLPFTTIPSHAGKVLGSAIGPAAESRAGMVEPGSVPLPGLKSKEGIPYFMTTNPAEIRPMQDVLGLSSSTMGWLGKLGGAAIDLHIGHALAQVGKPSGLQKPAQITVMGMTPDEAYKAKRAYVLHGGEPGVFNLISRVYSAFQGLAAYGSAEAETVPTAVIGGLTGTLTKAPETMAESGARIAAALSDPEHHREARIFSTRFHELVDGKDGQPKPIGEVKTPYDDVAANIKTIKDAKSTMNEAVFRMLTNLKRTDITATDRSRLMVDNADWVAALRTRLVQLAQTEQGLQGTVKK